jgi:hypothetical protein
MTIEYLPPLAPGRYVVLWKNDARDGDAATGSIGFTVNAPAATPTPAPTELPPASVTPAPAQTCPPPASESPSASATAAAPTAVPTPQPADPAGSSGGDVLLPALVVLVLILGIGLGLVMRRRSA